VDDFVQVINPALALIVSPFEEPLKKFPRIPGASLNLLSVMARISFALLAAHAMGIPVEKLAETLALPEEFVRTRIEAARLCFLIEENNARP